MSEKSGSQVVPIADRIVKFGRKAASEFTMNPLNYRTHPLRQKSAVSASLRELGWIGVVVENITTGHLLDGHERIEQALARNGDVPFIQVQLTEEEEKLALAIFDPITAMAEVDDDILRELLADVHTDDLALQELLSDMLGEEAGGADVEPLLSVPKDARPNPRVLPIDVIYTLQGADCTCCLAVLAGLKYGIQSSSFSLCPYHEKLSGRHAVTFIDNDYFGYNHDRHLQVVKELHPKYATVRDIMTREQCAAAGIEYFELNRILEWAAELEEHAENVIVIPKYDCLDRIPERYILGYSVPTSHGGTPLPVALFRSWRVHLLGGSWKAQLAHMAELGDAVVSVDNNHVSLVASQWARFYDINGDMQSLSDIGLGSLNNPRYVALAMSFGAMGAKVNELYAPPTEE